jgi:hypothetical protein
LTVTLIVEDAVQPKPLVTVYDMVAFPADTPDTIPDVPTVATPTALLDHTPLDVALARLVVPFTQTVAVPVMAATTGSAFTVTIAVDLPTHPKPLVTV